MAENVGEEVAKELAKQAYEDGGKAIVKPLGETGGLLVRAVKAALSPLEKWVLQREYSVAETQKLLEQKLASIPAERIQPPEQYIALPAMQYISYCMDEENLRDLYANLLANSMIDIVKDGVHPGFVEIIKQLSPDEAKILQYMSSNEIIPTLSLRYQNDKGQSIYVVRDFSNIGEFANCEHPYETEKYFDNLIRLGLVVHNEVMSHLSDENRYKPLKEHKYLEEYKHIDTLIQQGFSNVNTEEGFIRLSSFGKAFCSICVTPPQITHTQS